MLLSLAEVSTLPLLGATEHEDFTPISSKAVVFAEDADKAQVEIEIIGYEYALFIDSCIVKKYRLLYKRGESRQKFICVKFDQLSSVTSSNMQYVTSIHSHGKRLYGHNYV